MKTVKEKKIEEQEITLLQSRGNSHSPNYAILNKLREEMKKFKAMKVVAKSNFDLKKIIIINGNAYISCEFLQSAIRPIGKFIPPDDVELPAESGTDLSNVLM